MYSTHSRPGSRTRRWLVTLATTGALMFSGCTMDDDPAPAEEPPVEEEDEPAGDEEPPADNGEPVTLGLVAENTGFDQETLTVPAGATVMLEFDNRDQMGHNFALYEDDTAADEIFVGDVVTGTTTTYEFQAPEEPGTYYFQCDLHPQQMNGEFIVEEP
jgi:plastocyanin